MPHTRELSLLLLLLAAATVSDGVSLWYHGFKDANLTLSNLTVVTPDGLLHLTDDTQDGVGHGFYPFPLRFGPAVSFSSVFVVAIVPKYPDRFGHGITFALAPSPTLPDSMSTQSLGLLNATSSIAPTSSNPNASSQPRVVAVELDTGRNHELQDIDNNHIGIDVNSMVSVQQHTAAVYDRRTDSFKNFSLVDGEPIWVWVDYDGSRKRMNVAVARTGPAKPEKPLLAEVPVDVAALVAAECFVGFTASTGSSTESHYVLGWSFATGGDAAQELDPTKLPKVPKTHAKKTVPPVLAVGIALAVAAVLVLAAVFGGRFWLERRCRYAEELEDWEAEYGPHRFAYKDLYKATAGFGDANVVGAGGFGKVYYGTMPNTSEKVAVKRISHDSKQGTREFVAEVAAMGRLRHRNLVQLLGYCRRSGELLLVYEFMHNGSLDWHLFGRGRTLDWGQRLHIIKGVATGLLYLHEGWEQVVVHRDIKAGNVLLDRHLNGRLGDFGLARLYDRGGNSQTTRVVGTLGYLAPEMSQTGKATTATDVYAFGAFLLEVVTGRRPVDPSPSTTGIDEETGKGRVREPEPGEALVDWVLDCWRNGELLQTVDRRLPASGSYTEEEVEKVLRLGVMCSHPDPATRPGMRQVVGILEGEVTEKSDSPDAITACAAAMRRSKAFDAFSMSYPLLTATTATTSSVMTVESPFGSHSSGR